LAVFVGADDFHVYRLPFVVEEQLILTRAYYLQPVWPLFTNNGRYYILAFSQNEVRLFEATRHSAGQIDLPENTPASLAEALQYDDLEKQLQFHTGTAPGDAGAGIFHGHGPGEEEQKERIERYLNLVDAGLREFLRDGETPLVLAGVEYLLPIYREVSEYPHILKEGITGNPEYLRPEELQAQTWPVVEPYFRRETEAVLEQYRQRIGTGAASDNIEEIVPAAFYGRIDKLILAVDAPQLWGTFNPETGQVEHTQARQSREANLALVDFAAMQTLQNSGTVYALAQGEMPASGPVAAVFRY
jgi:hypothetical protein